MKLTPYKDLITMGKEALDKALAPIRANSVKKQGELQACKLEERIATMQTEINELASKKEVNFDLLIDKLDELALAERRKEQFEEVLSQMFPEEKK